MTPSPSTGSTSRSATSSARSWAARSSRRPTATCRSPTPRPKKVGRRAGGRLGGHVAGASDRELTEPLSARRLSRRRFGRGGPGRDARWRGRPCAGLGVPLESRSASPRDGSLRPGEMGVERPAWTVPSVAAQISKPGRGRYIYISLKQPEICREKEWSKVRKEPPTSGPEVFQE